jgi:hypothetical protein
VFPFALASNPLSSEIIMTEVTWAARTMRDAIHEARAARAAQARALTVSAVDPDNSASSMNSMAASPEDPYPHLDNPPATCPVCHTTTNAGMLIDVTPLPASVRGAADFACDSCYELWITKGIITREALAAALGAPEDALAEVRAYDARVMRYRHAPRPPQMER